MSLITFQVSTSESWLSDAKRDRFVGAFMQAALNVGLQENVQIRRMERIPNPSKSTRKPNQPA